MSVYKFGLSHLKLSQLSSACDPMSSTSSLSVEALVISFQSLREEDSEGNEDDVPPPRAA